MSACPPTDEPVADPYRWRLQRQSRPGRLGGDPGLEGQAPRAVRRRAADHQQPHGADGGDRRLGDAEAAEPGRLFTDSQYLRKGITEWIDAWRKRGWRTADKKPVKNQDLWERLDAARRTHEVDWHWLKGHAGHADNERCDELARDEIRRLRGPIGRKSGRLR